MKLVHAAVLLLCFSLPACRKVPSIDYVSTFFTSEPERTEVVVSPPKPVAPPDPDPTPAVDRSAQVIVLGYHRIVDKVRHPDTEITPAEFEAQMQALKDQGIAVISLEDFLAWRQEARSIPPRCALITIDDGYNIAYTVAWPILKKFGYPFTLFIYTDYVRGGVRSGGGSMTWEQLAELRDAGVSIQSHTASHADLRRQKKGSPDSNPNEWLWNELHGSKALLEEKLGIKVTALALPFGLGNDQVRRTAAEAGYEMAFTVNGQKIGFGTPMDALGRYMVQANQPKLFTTAVTFEGTGAGGVPAAARLAIADLRPQPPEGASIADTDPLIQASLATIDPVDPGSVSVRVSGMGQFAARFDPQTRMVQCQTRGLMPNKYTVILAAKSRGKKIESRWSFTVESPGAPSPAPDAGPRR